MVSVARVIPVVPPLFKYDTGPPLAPVSLLFACKERGVECDYLDLVQRQLELAGGKYLTPGRT